MLPQVREALDTRRLLRISYYSASTDRVTVREIAPLRLFASEGHWYVDAWCLAAGGLRRFRVDRINEAEQLDAGFPPEAALERSLPRPVAVKSPDRKPRAGPIRRSEPGPRPGRDIEAYVPGPDSGRVRLSLDPATAWLVESVPAVGPPTGGGTGSRSSSSWAARPGWNDSSSGSVLMPGWSSRRSTGPWAPRPPLGSSGSMDRIRK